MLKTSLYKMYEIVFILLAIITVIMLILSLSIDLEKDVQNIFNLIDTGILVIFAIDYFVRFIKADNKIKFIKSNVFDLLSIIPFDSLFRTLRLFRIFRLLKATKLVRLFALTGRLNKNISQIIKTNHFHYIIYITCSVIIVGAIGISFAENKTLSDSIWWSIVTTTTVGYGDIAPQTMLGRIIAVVLMFVGIGFIGTLTSAISTYFIKSPTGKKTSVKQVLINEIKTQLDNIDYLSTDEINELCGMIKSLQSINKNINNETHLSISKEA